MNRFIIFLLFIVISIAAPAQEYSGTTTPSLTDTEVLLLRKIAKSLNDSRTGTAPLTSTSTLAGGQLTPAITSTTSDGATTAGKKVLIFILSSDFTGTIGGVVFTGSADSSLELRAPDGYTFAAVSYTRSAGTLRLIQY